MKLPVVLTVLVGIFTLACSSAAPVQMESTPKVNVTAEAKLSEDQTSLPTATQKAPLPTNTPGSVPTKTPVPTTKPTHLSDITQVVEPTEFISSKDYIEFDELETLAIIIYLSAINKIMHQQIASKRHPKQGT